MHAAVETAVPAQESAEGNTAIAAHGLGKCYEIYGQPRDRLLQSIFRGRRRFYEEFWAVRDLSFTVERGETVGIIGRNGSGKSTLLQLVAGTLTPTTGSVAVRGRVAALLELGSGFNPEYTGRENIFLNGAILGLARDEIDRRLPAILRFSELEEFVDRPVKTYSSGMLMRLAFSVAVNVEPDILIVDEALAVGDTAFQLKCVERLDRLVRSGVTMLFVSHDVTLVKTFCQRVLYLERGQLKAEGKPDVMSELYAFDARQTEGTRSGKSVLRKPFIGEGAGIAFGTEEGRIVAAAFRSTGSARASSPYGNDLVFDVEVEYAETVPQPCLSIILHDRHARELGGAYFRIGASARAGGMRRATLRCGLGVRLGAGAYSITLRLENRHSEQLAFPIDKQVNALVFEVAQPERNAYIGFIDLGITCEPVAESA